jgi:cardiolipin synthase
MHSHKNIHGFTNLLNRRLFIILLILGQLALFAFTVLQYSYLRWVNALLNVISIVTALHLLTRPEQKPFKISLIFLILLFPLFGGVFYWILHFQTKPVGYRRHLARIQQESRENACHGAMDANTVCTKFPDGQKLMRYLQNTSGFPIYENTQTKYFPTGKEMLASLIEDLERAERYIFLEYFIVEEGIMWNSILEVLTKKAKDGVDVRVIYDDLGCFLTLPPGYAKKLRAAGIHCQVFNKVLPFVSTSHNNRDHRKIAVIDGTVAYTGGMNLADEYINEKIKYGHWKDNAIRLQGNGAWSFTVMFLHMWSLLSGRNEDVQQYLPKNVSTPLSDGWVQPYCDSPIDKETVSEHVYSAMMEKAEHYLYITTPYLMIDDGLLSSLKLCAKSGVDVRIVTPSHPDKKLVHFTTRSYYRELIASGVKVYEYADGFIHAKSFLVDDTVASVGTVNLDFRSLYFHFECGTCLYRTSSIAALKQDYLDTLQHCRQITAEDCRTTPPVRLMQDVFRLFAPLM